MACRQYRQAEHNGRQNDIDDEGAPGHRPVQRAPRRVEIEGEGGDPHRESELGRARHLPGHQRGVGQRAIGDEFALRNQDHARHREHQHQREPQQGIDRAVGDAVLDQEQHDRRVQGRTLPPLTGPICHPVRRAGPSPAANALADI